MTYAQQLIVSTVSKSQDLADHILLTMASFMLDLC